VSNTILAASVVGSSHTKSGLPCQDAHAVRDARHDRLLLAVADGAGTADHSDRGAALAAETAVDYLYALVGERQPENAEAWRVHMLKAFSQARSKVLELAASEGLEARQFASTLTVVAAHPEWLISGQIGDCSAVAQLENGDLKVIAEPQKGEYANETVFLTMNDALDRLDWQTFSAQDLGLRCVSVAVFSDGLSRLAMQLPGNTPHAPFFEPVFRFARNAQDAESGSVDLAGFLGSDRINIRTDDDKTLVVAVWPWEEPVHEQAPAEETGDDLPADEVIE
jgi:hypothetical protein